MYVTPVAVVSICLNIPKFMENEVKETDNSTQIDIAEMRLHPTYMLYYTISQIFHPTLTTGLVPMGVLIFMNLAIYKGNICFLSPDFFRSWWQALILHHHLVWNYSSFLADKVYFGIFYLV